MPNIDSATDAVIRQFHDQTLNDFRKAENRLIEKEYKTIPFPFEELKMPHFEIRKQITPADVFGLLRS